MIEDEMYMRRCFQLARLGGSRVSPNPLVGAVLVHQNRIIGEGYHHQYGTAHAEVQAVQSVVPSNRPLIAQSTLYVSLEPCCIYGRTPPCTQLILQERIPRVVLSCLDQTPEVRGRGIQILKDAGVQVTSGILETEGLHLARFRNYLAAHQKPYTILKYAVSSDFKLGMPDKQVWLSNPLARRWAHRLRHETAAILIGTHTALSDNPALDSRYGFINQPSKLIIDLEGKLPNNLRLFNHPNNLLVLCEHPDRHPARVTGARCLQVRRETLLEDIQTICVQQGLNSLLIEGGAFTLRQFIAQNCWNEAFLLHTPVFLGSNGIPAPFIPSPFVEEARIADNRITRHVNSSKMG